LINAMLYKIILFCLLLLLICIDCGGGSDKKKAYRKTKMADGDSFYDTSEGGFYRLPS